MTNKHGGAGRGQGRKAQYSEPLTGLTIHLTSTHRETLAKLGGPKAVRDWLDSQAKKSPQT